MEISKASSGASFYGTDAVRGSGAQTTQKPPEPSARKAEETRVELSAEAQKKLSAAQSAPTRADQSVRDAGAQRPVAEKARGGNVQEKPGSEYKQAQSQQAQSRRDVQEQERRAEQARQASSQKGFSFNGAAAYSRVSSS